MPGDRGGEVDEDVEVEDVEGLPVPCSRRGRVVVVVAGRRGVKMGVGGEREKEEEGSYWSAYSMCVLLAPGVPSGRKCWMWWYVMFGLVLVSVVVRRESWVGRAYSMCSAVGPSERRE